MSKIFGGISFVVVGMFVLMLVAVVMYVTQTNQMYNSCVADGNKDYYCYSLIYRPGVLTNPAIGK